MQVTLLLINTVLFRFFPLSFHSLNITLQFLYIFSIMSPKTLMQILQTNLKSGENGKMIFFLGFQAREISFHAQFMFGF